MIVVNTETIPGYTITMVKGMVQGNTVRVLGVNSYWTLRIDEAALCVARDDTVIYVRN